MTGTSIWWKASNESAGNCGGRQLLTVGFYHSLPITNSPNFPSPISGIFLIFILILIQSGAGRSIHPFVQVHIHVNEAPLSPISPAPPYITLDLVSPKLKPNLS